MVRSSVKDIRSTLDETWRAMELLLERGTCRSIGVSNFSIQDLEKLMESASVVPHVRNTTCNKITQLVSALLVDLTEQKMD